MVTRELPAVVRALQNEDMLQRDDTGDGDSALQIGAWHLHAGSRYARVTRGASGSCSVEGMRFLSIVVCAGLACGGTDSKSPDAAGSNNLPACTGQLYDTCDPNASNCAGSDVCKAYGASGFSVCVPAQGACTTGGCPNQGSATVACNTMGFCKPAAPNSTCQ